MVKVAADRKRKFESAFLVWMITVMCLVVMIPLQSPQVRGQITHLASAAAEDWTGPPMPPNLYDMNPTVGYVMWDVNEDHIISSNYVIEPGYTVDVPGRGGGAGMQVQFPNQDVRLDVYGTLITNNDGSISAKTNFVGTGANPYDGIYIHSGGSARFVDCLIHNSLNGVVFKTGSRMDSPGISSSGFFNNYNSYLILNGVNGHTNIGDNSYFDDGLNPTATLVGIYNAQVNITNTIFLSHGSIKSQLHILDADVFVEACTFYNENIPGNSIFIEGLSNDTVLNEVVFQDGVPDSPYILSEGVSFLIGNCSFHTSGGALSVLARINGTNFVPAHVTVLNPTADGVPGYYDDTFDKSTLIANYTSDITLQWYLDVLVKDQGGTPIPNKPVWVMDRYANPAQPFIKMTDSNGWARWFVCTEFIKYDGSGDHFDPYNVSAENNSMIGYAIPELVMNMSKNTTVTVPYLVIGPSPSPSPPTGLYAQLSGSITHVKISWNASADDGKGENDVEGYTVYKSSSGINGSYLFEAWIPADGSSSYSWIDLNAGDGDWNNYFYIVRANDSENNEEANNNKVGKFVNYLYDDWNLFSIPLIQLNNSKDYILSSIEDNYIAIHGYHAGKSRPWLRSHKMKPPHFNDIIEIDPGSGYYIKMADPDYLVIAGSVPTITEIPLKTGWNLVGYTCLVGKTVEDALSSISGKYNMVENFDPILGKEIRLNPDDWMEPGYGFWIHATEDCIWQIFY